MDCITILNHSCRRDHLYRNDHHHYHFLYHIHHRVRQAGIGHIASPTNTAMLGILLATQETTNDKRVFGSKGQFKCKIQVLLVHCGM